MKAWKIAVIVGMVAILAVGASVVFAQGEDPNPPGDEIHPCWHRGPFRRNLGDDEAPWGPLGERPDVNGEHAELHALMQSAFAEALGMSVEELESQLESERGLMGVAIAQGLSEEEARALLEEAHSAAIQEAVEQRLIDEEQAQHMQERMQRAGPGMRGPLGERTDVNGEHAELHALMQSTFAEALGMSVEELESQLETEKGLMGVAIAQGLSEEDARALFEEARADAIQDAVGQGLIDEEQAQRMLEHVWGAEPGMGDPHGHGQTPGGRGWRGPFGQDGSD